MSKIKLKGLLQRSTSETGKEDTGYRLTEVSFEIDMTDVSDVGQIQNGLIEIEGEFQLREYPGRDLVPQLYATMAATNATWEPIPDRVAQSIHDEVGATENQKRKSESSNKEGEVEYCAVQHHRQVHILASGKHSVTGYKVFLDPERSKAYPPEFSLKQIAPDAHTVEVETPFRVATRFYAASTVTKVVIHDANGPHPISVHKAAIEKRLPAENKQ